MKKTTLIVLLSATLFAINVLELEEIVPEQTAVSKVMQRFNKKEVVVEPIMIVSNEGVKEENAPIQEESILRSDKREKLEITPITETVKFENDEMAYPKSGIVDRVEIKESNLLEIQAHVRKVIEEEKKKVEEVKEKALERINEAMELVTKAKQKEDEESF
jgi:hypothetical protein